MELQLHACVVVRALCRHHTLRTELQWWCDRIRILFKGADCRLEIILNFIILLWTFSLVVVIHCERVGFTSN